MMHGNFNIRGYTKTSLCDWPGKTSTVLFMGGCNLACPTCHNRELWDLELDRQPPKCGKQAFRYLKQYPTWLDGVVVTGGEPTVNDDLEMVLQAIKRIGLQVKLDTNGMRPYAVSNLISAGLVDTVAVDIKGPFPKYPLLTGNAVTIEQAQENLEQIFSLARQAPGTFYFRTTLVPFLTQEDLEVCRGYLPDSMALHLQPYRKPTLHVAEDATMAHKPEETDECLLKL